MKILTIAVTAAFSAAAFAAVAKTNAVDREWRFMMKHTGGQVRKPNSAYGKVMVLNAQKRVAVDAFQSALQTIEHDVHPIIELKSVDSVNLLNPKADITAAGGAMGIALVDDATVAGLVIAPEECWAIVNVAALAKDTPKDEVLASRTRKEILRAFGLVGGCAFMSRTKIVLSGNVVGPKGLDVIPFENYGVEALMTLERSLPLRGVMPWVQTTYAEACQQGWAPLPTNEYQKAIWDKAYEIPDQPLKIKYEKPAAGK